MRFRIPRRLSRMVYITRHFIHIDLIVFLFQIDRESMQLAILFLLLHVRWLAAEDGRTWEPCVTLHVRNRCGTVLFHRERAARYRPRRRKFLRIRNAWLTLLDRVGLLTWQ